MVTSNAVKMKYSEAKAHIKLLRTYKWQKVPGCANYRKEWRYPLDRTLRYGRHMSFFVFIGMPPWIQERYLQMQEKQANEELNAAYKRGGI